MKTLLLGLALLQSQGYDEKDFINHGGPPLMITAYTAASESGFPGMGVEVCGNILALYPERHEAMMGGQRRAIMVDTRGRARLRAGRAACVTGVILRRDGLTATEALLRGIGRTILPGGLAGDIILRQCHDPASCDRLMEPAPVRRVAGEPPAMITAPAAATNPELIDRPVEVCGHIVALYPERNEAMMAGEQKAIMIDTRGRAELVVRRPSCVTGVIRRRDGLTEQERRERGLGRSYLSHGPTPDIILYQCHDPASCDRLMQPGPVREEQLDTATPR